MISILVVDDHAVVRSGLRMLLNGKHGFEVVGEAADGDEAAQGYSNKEIADQLIISVKTVETHKSNLMEKLDLRTLPDLVKFAMKKGLLNFE